MVSDADRPEDESGGGACPTMPVREFRQLGLLQEINRQFLHPLGLALMVRLDVETGEEFLEAILDCRADPIGFVFDELDIRKGQEVIEWQAAAAQRRLSLLGFVVQPLR